MTLAWWLVCEHGEQLLSVLTHFFKITLDAFFEPNFTKWKSQNPFRTFLNKYGLKPNIFEACLA